MVPAQRAVCRLNELMHRKHVAPCQGSVTVTFIFIARLQKVTKHKLFHFGAEFPRGKGICLRPHSQVRPTGGIWTQMVGFHHLKEPLFSKMDKDPVGKRPAGPARRAGPPAVSCWLSTQHSWPRRSAAVNLSCLLIRPLSLAVSLALLSLAWPRTRC